MKAQRFTRRRTTLGDDMILLGLLIFFGVSAFVAITAAMLWGRFDECRDVHDTRPAWMSDFDGEYEGS